MSYSKINQSNASVLNRITVFNIIKEQQEIQRDQIKTITGLQKSTLTYILQDLSRFGLIRQVKVRKSGKIGVAPLNIMVDREKYFFLGIDAELDSVKCAVMDLSNNVVFTKDSKFSFTAKNFTSKIFDIITQVKEETRKEFLAVGLSMPGVMDYDKNSISVSNLFGIKNLDMGQELEKKLNIPVFLENNANAAAFGEYTLYYKHKSQNDSPMNLYYVFFHLSKKHKTRNTGIGSGIILDGKLYYGDYNAAGEIGDIIDNIVKENFRKEADSFRDNFIHILTDADQGSNKKAVNTVAKFASSLGFYISNIVNILNTSIVVIGGDYPLSYGNFFTSLKEGIHDNLINFLRDKVEINRSRDEKFSAAKGAAILAQNKIFTYQYFNKIFKF